MFVHMPAIISSWPNIQINQHRSESEAFSKYFNIIDESKVSRQIREILEDEFIKSKSSAVKSRNEGNIEFKNNNLNAALKYYNKSISIAPRDSDEFGFAVANRSAVLFKMNKYEECLKDINLVLRSEYPKNLKHKVFLRQANCFLELNKESQAEKSLKRAEENISKFKKYFTKSQINEINNKINTTKSLLEENTKSKLVHNDDCKLELPTFQNGENPKFLNASNDLEIKYKKSIGRYVVSKSDIKEGDVLFIEQPYVSTTISHIFDYKHCGHCYETTYAYVPCNNCSVVFYCCDDCRQKSWDLEHKWICYGARNGLLTYHSGLVLLLLFKASYDRFKTEIEDETVYGDKNNNYPFINKLLTNKKKMSSDNYLTNVKTSVFLIIYLKHFTNYFDWLYIQQNRPEGSKDKLISIIGGLIIKYAMQTQINETIICDSILEYLKKRVVICNYAIGLAIFPSIALLNHSCEPNTCTSFYNNVNVVKAVKNIKAGTEITTSYLNSESLKCSTKVRQESLKEYHFICSCGRCTKKPIETSPFLCVRCCGKAFLFDGCRAKCENCYNVFTCLEHIQKFHMITHYFPMIFSVDNFDDLSSVMRDLKKYFHKSHIFFCVYYDVCVKYYLQTGNIKQSLEYIKLRQETAANIFGTVSSQNAIHFIEHIIMSIKYCHSLKNKQSENYKKSFAETEQLIKDSTNILKHFLNNKNVFKYVNELKNYLVTGELKYKDDHDEPDEETINNLKEFFCRLRSYFNF